MRLDKYLSNMGIGSRKEVKEYIKKGLVIVNGEALTKPTAHIDENKDVVKFNNQNIEFKEYFYIMLNKPQGVVSATRDHSETVIDLLESKYQNKDIFPAGRLDKDTEGLLLLTNDGKLAHELLSPKKNVFKKYYAKVDKPLENNDIIKFKNGIFLEKESYLTLPAKLEIISDLECFVYIQEGKYHQVKRMLADCGKEVLYLKRISMGNLELDETLMPGEYRELTDNELELLKNEVV